MQIVDIRNDPNLIGLWYLQMKGCGRADQVFYADPDHNLEMVLSWGKRQNALYGAFRDDMLIGVSFVDNLLSFHSWRRAELGFGFLPNCTGFQALGAGRLMMDAAFTDLGVNHMFGTTPELNKKALQYSRLLGLKQYPVIPNFCNYLGQCCGVVYSHISKEQWNEQRKTEGRSRVCSTNE